MGFRLKVTGGPEEITFDERAIVNAEFLSDSPNDSNARATDVALSIKVWGKMLYSLGGKENDATLNVAKWSQVPSEKPDCYRSAQLDIVAASQMVRQYTLPDAFVMEYKEELDDETGVGTFYLHMKQKKDQNAAVKLEGGFGAE
jgi:hypothetical protein